MTNQEIAAGVLELPYSQHIAMRQAYDSSLIPLHRCSRVCLFNDASFPEYYPLLARQEAAEDGLGQLSMPVSAVFWPLDLFDMALDPTTAYIYFHAEDFQITGVFMLKPLGRIVGKLPSRSLHYNFDGWCQNGRSRR